MLSVAETGRLYVLDCAWVCVVQEKPCLSGAFLLHGCPGCDPLLSTGSLRAVTVSDQLSRCPSAYMQVKHRGHVANSSDMPRESVSCCCKPNGQSSHLRGEVTSWLSCPWMVKSKKLVLVLLLYSKLQKFTAIVLEMCLAKCKWQGLALWVVVASVEILEFVPCEWRTTVYTPSTWFWLSVATDYFQIAVLGHN